MLSDINNERDIKLYEPIKDTENFINIFVENLYSDDGCKKYLTELENGNPLEQKKATIIKKTINDIQVYNTNISPLFLAKDLGIILGITNIKSTIRTYNDQEKVIGYILQNGKMKEKYFLTKHGVYRIILCGRNKLSDLFRTFVYVLMDKMLNYELDKMRSIMNECMIKYPDKVEAAKIELYNNSEKFRKLYEKEKKEREIWTRKAEEEHEKNMLLDKEKTEVEIQNSFNEMYIEQLNYDKNMYLKKIRYLKDNKTYHRDEEDILNILKRRYLKEINIFIVKPAYIKKLAKDNISADSLNRYIENYNLCINEFNRDIDLISDIDMYYYIVFKKTTEDTDKYTHICTEYVYDKNKYFDMINILKEEFDIIKIPTNKKEGDHIFKTTSECIQNIINSMLLEDDTIIEPIIE